MANDTKMCAHQSGIWGVETWWSLWPFEPDNLILYLPPAPDHPFVFCLKLIVCGG